MINNIVLMFSPSDEKTPYEQGEPPYEKRGYLLKSMAYFSVGSREIDSS